MNTSSLSKYDICNAANGPYIEVLLRQTSTDIKGFGNQRIGPSIK